MYCHREFLEGAMVECWAMALNLSRFFVYFRLIHLLFVNLWQPFYFLEIFWDVICVQYKYVLVLIIFLTNHQSKPIFGIVNDFFLFFRSSNGLFELVWQGDGSVSFRANNGKFLATKRAGHLYANADTIDDSSKYYFYLINR